MLLAAKHLDPIIGVDIHLIITPAGVTVPIPHPFLGFVFDVMDLIPIKIPIPIPDLQAAIKDTPTPDDFTGQVAATGDFAVNLIESVKITWVPLNASIKVNGLCRAQAGTGAVNMPFHIPIGGLFVKMMGFEGEIFMGSKTVLADSQPFCYTFLPTITCNDIGVPKPIRMKKTGTPEAPEAKLFLPVSVVTPIPMGRMVTVGGPPTIQSLSAWLMRFGIGMLFRGLAKAANKVSKIVKEALPTKLGGRKALPDGKCGWSGHPVEIASGLVMTEIMDFELPGPIPFQWKRKWYSDSNYAGSIGHGWYHAYSFAMGIDYENSVIGVRLNDGRVATFPMLKPGESYFNRSEKLTMHREEDAYLLQDADNLTYHFGHATEIIPGGLELTLLSKIEDLNGHAIYFEYSWDNVLKKIIDSAGRILKVHNDSERRINSIDTTHPERETETVTLVRYKYDAEGNLGKSYDALGHAMTYQYENHLLIRETNRNGLSFYFKYLTEDGKSKCFHTWGDGGIYNHKLSYEEGKTVVENSLGYKTTHYHRDGLIYKTVNSLGAVTIYLYNEYNELISEKNPLGYATTYAYDERGNQTMIISPDGATTQLVYNAYNKVIKATDPIGGEWTWNYDEKGNLFERVDAMGHVTKFEYQQGLLSRIINPLGDKTILGYDHHHNITQMITPDGQVSWWRYDIWGRCAEIVDPKGNTQKRILDLAGQIIHIEEPDGNVCKLSYDPEGNVVGAKDKQHEIQFEYGGFNKLKARIANGTRVVFQYDTEEQLTGIVNEHRYVYQFDLDSEGNVELESGFDEVKRFYKRNLAGQVISVLRATGIESFYEYDMAGRVIRVHHSNEETECYTYREDGALMAADNLQHTVIFARDLLGRITTETSDGIGVHTTYDAIGRRISVQSSLGASLHFDRNTMGDVNRITTGGDVPWEVQMRRDVMGIEMERSMPGGVYSRWKRDRLGRPVAHQISVKGSTKIDRSYEWGVNNRLRQIIDTNSGTTTFTHDEVGNLTGAQYGDNTVELRMPDAVGNLFRTRDRKDRKYGPGGQLLEAKGTKYQYDEEGNLIQKREADGKTWHYTWNAAGMLERVTRPEGTKVTFTYDALGRRISKTHKGKTTRWVWDVNVPLHEWVEDTLSTVEAQPLWKVLPQTAQKEELLVSTVPSNGPPDIQTSLSNDTITWIFEPETFTPVGKLQNNQHYSIVTDYLGTPIQIFSEKGEKIWAAETNIYGQLRNLNGERSACPFRYLGQYEDVETGLYYNRFRYYNPDDAMYLSQDPTRLQGGFSFYNYVKDTTIFTDIFGLAESVDPNTINFSQRTVGPEVEQYTSDMKNNNWDWDKSGPIRVMENNGQLVAYDNRRLMAAQNAPLKEVPIERVNPDAPHPNSSTGKTWRQKFNERFNDVRNKKAGGIVPPTGLKEQPTIVCKK